MSQKFVLKTLDQSGAKVRLPMVYATVHHAALEAGKRAAAMGRPLYVYEHGPRGKFLRLVNPPPASKVSPRPPRS